MRLSSPRINLPFKTEYNFKFEWDEIDESSEDETKSMNEIFSNLFSTKRLKWKIFLVNRKKKRVNIKL